MTTHRIYRKTSERTYCSLPMASASVTATTERSNVTYAYCRKIQSLPHLRGRTNQNVEQTTETVRGITQMGNRRTR